MSNNSADVKGKHNIQFLTWTAYLCIPGGLDVYLMNGWVKWHFSCFVSMAKHASANHIYHEDLQITFKIKPQHLFYDLLSQHLNTCICHDTIFHQQIWSQKQCISGLFPSFSPWKLFFGFLCHRKLKVLLPQRAKYNTETSAVGWFLNHANKRFGER